MSAAELGAALREAHHRHEVGPVTSAAELGAALREQRSHRYEV